MVQRLVWMKNLSERVVRDKRQLVISPQYLSYLVFICEKLCVLLEVCLFAWWQKKNLPSSSGTVNVLKRWHFGRHARAGQYCLFFSSKLINYHHEKETLSEWWNNALHRRMINIFGRLQRSGWMCSHLDHSTASFRRTQISPRSLLITWWQRHPQSHGHSLNGKTGRGRRCDTLFSTIFFKKPFF